MELRFAWYMVLGILLLLVIKYVVLGLNSWDSIFHPGRTEPSNSMFLQPLLGGFWTKGCSNGCNS